MGTGSITFKSTTLVSYDFRLTDGADDGQEVIGVSWSATGAFQSNDNNGNTTMEAPDNCAAWSFPGLYVTSCSAATLTVRINGSGGGTFLLRGASQASGPSAQWAPGNRPSGATQLLTMAW